LVSGFWKQNITRNILTYLRFVWWELAAVLSLSLIIGTTNGATHFQKALTFEKVSAFRFLHPKSFSAGKTRRHERLRFFPAGKTRRHERLRFFRRGKPADTDCGAFFLRGKPADTNGCA